MAQPIMPGPVVTHSPSAPAGDTPLRGVAKAGSLWGLTGAIAAAVLAALLAGMPAGTAPAGDNRQPGAQHTPRDPVFNTSETKAPHRKLSKPLAFSNLDLPRPVAEMREAILAAARTGNVDELLIPIQWNELPPDFGGQSPEKTLEAWKTKSPSGAGYEWLALIINLLEAPHAVVRKGRDVENNKVYIWPAFAEIPLDKLSPRFEVELNRLLSAKEIERMKKTGRYDGYGIAIGADGTWHAFKRVNFGSAESQAASQPPTPPDSSAVNKAAPK